MNKKVQEAGGQFITRLSTHLRPSFKNFYPTIIPSNSLKPGDLLEINGGPNVGKSILLLELIAETLLPVQFGGLNAGVLYVDNDKNMLIFQLEKILRKRIGNGAQPEVDDLLSEDEIITLVKESLSRLAVYRCYDSKEFEFTLISLNATLTFTDQFGLIVIDSISAFYWNEITDTIKIRMDTHVNRIVKQILKLCETLQLVGVYSLPSNYGGTSSSRNDLISGTIELKQIVPDEYDYFEALITFHKDKKIDSRMYSIDSNGFNWQSRITT